MKQIHKTLIVGVLGTCLYTSLRSEAQLSAVHLFDFEGDGGTNLFGGGITEPGWQKITAASNTTAGVPGWIAGDTHNTYGTAIYRGPSTQAPDLVIRELMIGSGQGTPVIGVSEPTMAFRDIIPTNAFDVSYTIWRSDPGDNFHASFLTTISINGGAETLVDSGHNVVGFYHPPITGFLQLQPTNVVTTLDFRFYDNFAPYTGSQVRLNGMLTVFSVPEPTTSALVLIASAAGLIARRKRGKSLTTRLKALPSILGAGLAAGTLFCTTNAHALLTVTEQYDFGSATSPTQAGWTAVTFAQKFGGGTSGFDVANLSFGTYDRDPSTWVAQAQSFITLTNLSRDGIYGRNAPISLVWHDVLPNSATNAFVTLWLGDPADHNFGLVTALAAHNGITNTIGVWNESAHFVTNLTANIGPLQGAGTLDIILSVPGTSDSSLARWSGLEIVYSVPEPSVSLLLACGLITVLGMRRMRRSKQ